VATCGFAGRRAVQAIKIESEQHGYVRVDGSVGVSTLRRPSTCGRMASEAGGEILATIHPSECYANSIGISLIREFVVDRTIAARAAKPALIDGGRRGSIAARWLTPRARQKASI
jgi:hypothetical protein